MPREDRLSLHERIGPAIGLNGPVIELLDGSFRCPVHIEARFRLDLSKFSMQRTRLRTVRFICDYTTRMLCSEAHEPWHSTRNSQTILNFKNSRFNSKSLTVCVELPTLFLGA